MSWGLERFFSISAGDGMAGYRAASRQALLRIQLASHPSRAIRHKGPPRCVGVDLNRRRLFPTRAAQSRASRQAKDSCAPRLTQKAGAACFGEYGGAFCVDQALQIVSLQPEGLVTGISFSNDS